MDYILLPLAAIAFVVAFFFFVKFFLMFRLFIGKKLGLWSENPDANPYANKTGYIDPLDYERYILVQNATNSHLKEIIEHYLKRYKDIEPAKDWIMTAEVDGWDIIKVGKITSQFTYHNLTCYINGYNKSVDKEYKNDWVR